ncbi:MAG: hypothetical protein GF331_07440 [Chitinivibrionales bacterium]|nr:hypothetical protein [Chitinivibrionales bacterium]
MREHRPPTMPNTALRQAPSTAGTLLASLFGPDLPTERRSMLRLAHSLIGCTARATDGDIGRARDVYFDDSTWHVRYLVVDVGGWLVERDVLLAPTALGEPGKTAIPVVLTRKQIEHSPPTEAHKPVSLQHQVELHQYYGWPNYWASIGPAAYGLPQEPTQQAPLSQASPIVQEQTTSVRVADVPPDNAQYDKHLRSYQEVTEYNVCTGENKPGRLQDFIVETSTWTFVKAVVTVGHWPTAKQVLVEPAQVVCIDWASSCVKLADSAEELRELAPFDAAAAVNVDGEGRRRDYHGRYRS